MKKRLLSIMLCLALVITMFAGITIHVAAADDGLTLVDQDFKNLTAMPADWTLAVGTPGTHFEYHAQGLRPKEMDTGVGYYKTAQVDTQGAEYTFSTKFSSYSAPVYIHWGASTTDDARRKGISNTGYTFTAKASGDYKSGVYKLYKGNGTSYTEIASFTDSNTSWAYHQQRRNFSFNVTSTGIKVKGPFVYETGMDHVWIADNAPITTGYVGGWHGMNSVHSNVVAMESMKLVKSFAVNEAANVVPSPVLIDGTTPVKVAFNATIEPTTVTKANAYLADAAGNKINDDMYEVALEGTNTIVFTPSATNQLKYKTTYKAVVTTGIKTVADNALGANKGYPFTTENPPFEVMTSLYGSGTDPVAESSSGGEATDVTSLAGQSLTAKFTVSNTERYNYGDKSAYAIVSFEDANGKALKTIAKKVEVPSRGAESSYIALTTDESVTVPADATVMRSYILTSALDNYYPTPDAGAVISDIDATFEGDTVTVSGNAGTEAGKDVYLMMMNMESATTPYDFDTTVAKDTEFGSEIQKLAKTSTGENGAFTFTIPMNVTGTTAANWRFYIGGDEFSTAQMQEFYFANVAMKNSVADTVNNAATAADILAILEDDAMAKAIGIEGNTFIDAFETEDAATDPTAKPLMSELAAKLFDAKTSAEFDETDGGEEFITALNELSVYVAIKNDMRDLIVDPATGKFTDEADAVLGFDDLDTTNSITVTEVFEDELDSYLQTAVLDAIMGNDYSSPTEVYDVFKNNVMVEGFKGVADITGFLRDNATHFGIDLTAYNKLSTDQMSQTNDALKFATTLDATDVAGTVQTIIDTLIQGFDLSVYSYTFSTDDGTFSEWTFTGAHTFEEGNFKSTGNGPVYAISPSTTSGDYVLTASLSRSYNSAIYVFNYNAGNNLYFVDFNNGTSADNYTKKPVSLKKATGSNFDQNGSFTTLASNNDYTGGYSNMKIVVEEAGYVTVYNSAMTDAIIPRTYVGAPLTGGKFGAGFMNVSGAKLYSVTKSSYLGLTNVVESGQTDMTDTELAPVFAGTFNYPVDTATVTTDSVKILDADGNAIEGAVENVSVTNGGIDLAVTVKAGALDYKTDYYLNLTKDIKLALRDDSFANEVKLPFNTKSPELNITAMYDTAEGGSMAFTNDISRYKEIYTNINPNGLQAVSGQSASILMKGENTGASAKTVDIYVTIEDGTKTFKVVKVPNVTLAVGDGWITPSGFSATEISLATLSVPADVTATAKVKYYVIEDNARLTSAYPYAANVAVTDNGNRPTFSIVAEDLSVWGNTYSGAKGKVVNLVVEDSTNAAKIIATTKTGADGLYKFDITLNPTEFTSGSYHIYVGGEDFAAKVTPMNGSSEKTLEYKTPTERESVVSTVNGYPDTEAGYLAIMNVINSNAEELGFDSANENGVNVYKELLADNPDNIKAVAKKVAKKIADSAFDTNDGAVEFIKFVREAMAVQAYTASLENDLYGLDGSFLLDDIIDPKTVNGMTNTTTPATSVDAFNVYTKTLNAKGQEAVREALLGLEYIDTTAPIGTGKDEFLKKFIEQVVLASTNSANTDLGGAGHITEVIKNNGIVAGLTIENYNKYIGLGENVNELNTSILQNTMSNIGVLNSTINAYSNGGGGGGGGGGATIPPKGGIPGPGSGTVGDSATIAGGASITEVEESMKYTDLAGFEWADEAISALAKSGVISGDGNGKFRPGDRVKREELMKMALYGMDISINNYISTSFTDADRSHWAYKFVATAEEKGFTTGRGDGTFGFGADITREEVATILYRILVSLGKAGKADTSALNNFNDKSDVSDYAVDAISFMVDNGIINGVEANVLAPKSYCTRAQVAKMVYGVMNYLK